MGVSHPVMVGGIPHPVMVGGTQYSHGGGYLGYPPPSRPGRGSTPGTPHPDLGWGTPPPSDLGWGTPPPPPMVNRQTFPSINITFPRTTYAGGKNPASLQHFRQFVRCRKACDLRPTVLKERPSVPRPTSRKSEKPYPSNEILPGKSLNIWKTVNRGLRELCCNFVTTCAMKIFFHL